MRRNSRKINNLNIKDMELFDAIQLDDLDAVNRLLLNPRLDINQNDNQGYTPLIYASNTGNAAIGQRLIDGGADVNRAANNGTTALIQATLGEHKDFVVMLLEQPDINLDAQTGPGVSPGNIVILSAGGNTALLIALVGAWTGPNVQTPAEIASMLIESGADPNVVNADGTTPLSLAVFANRVDLIKMLVERGADINEKNKGGQTLLMRVVGSDALNYLLTLPGIDIDATDNNGWTALMHAARWKAGEARIISALLAAGADPLIKSNIGRTARQFVSGDGNTPKAELLLRAEQIWQNAAVKASQDLQGKFMIARRLRQGIATTTGSRLELPQRQLAEGIVRKAEYDNLCVGLQNNLNKPGVVALAKSLQIKTTRQTKNQLCNEIANRLII